MNNLTGTILANHSQIQVEEWIKQGNALEYNNGSNQRIVKNSIPAIEMSIKYSGLTKAQFDALVTVYEANHSSTVVIDADEIHDLRDTTLGAGGSVWAFKDFKFTVVAPQVYEGQIKLISSVFFNYTAYQNQFSQTSTYAPVSSSDTSFETVLNLFCKLLALAIATSRDFIASCSFCCIILNPLPSSRRCSSSSRSSDCCKET